MPRLQPKPPQKEGGLSTGGLSPSRAPSRCRPVSSAPPSSPAPSPLPHAPLHHVPRDPKPQHRSLVTTVSTVSLPVAPFSSLGVPPPHRLPHHRVLPAAPPLVSPLLFRPHVVCVRSSSTPAARLPTPRGTPARPPTPHTEGNEAGHRRGSRAQLRAWLPPAAAPRQGRPRGWSSAWLRTKPGASDSPTLSRHPRGSKSTVVRIPDPDRNTQRVFPPVVCVCFVGFFGSNVASQFPDQGSNPAAVVRAPSPNQQTTRELPLSVLNSQE